MDMSEEEQELKEQQEAEALFGKLSSTKSALSVAPVTNIQPKSMEESEETHDGESDLKLALKRMFPTFPIAILNTIAKAVMVGRILPDNMLDRINLTVTDLVQRLDEQIMNQEVSVMEVINLVTTAYEIGLNSKGRIDVIEMYGSAKENEKLEKLASDWS